MVKKCFRVIKLNPKGYVIATGYGEKMRLPLDPKSWDKTGRGKKRLLEKVKKLNKKSC